MSNTYLDPKIWGPHYWFFLHTVALSYPQHPNSVTKKKYYEFIQNLPLFIPIDTISKEFEQLIEKYPVTPYLDNRKSFLHWTHFIHNKINEKLEKPKKTLNDFLIEYYDSYKSVNETAIFYKKLKQKLIYLVIVCFILLFIYHFYNK
jgi:hypothetical protein